MVKRILVNVVDRDECRVAVLEDGILDDFFVERAGASSSRGNVYQARVINVEPGIQAAFVDIGGPGNAFLHASDCTPEIRGDEGVRSRPPPIQDFLRPGQELLVQVTREGIGRKGPTLTTFVSLPGRYVVLMPALGRRGISKKIEEEAERRRLRRILDDLPEPEPEGLILRTAAIGRSREAILADLEAVRACWGAMETRARGARAPVLVHEETDLLTRTLRDVLTDDMAEIHVDSDPAYERGLLVLDALAPGTRDRLHRHRDREPIFRAFGVEAQIEQIFSRKVPLPSGGHLVIDPTEALVAIDVNSGALTAEKGLEETAVRTDLEAVPEICRQLRLRDLGGVIVIDFIDVREPANRRRIEAALRECLSRDRARVRATRLSEFALVEMTRQRIGPGVGSLLREPCPECGGTGYVATIRSATLRALRRIKASARVGPGSRIVVEASPPVAADLTGARDEDLREVEAASGCTVEVLARADLEDGAFRVRNEGDPGAGAGGIS